MSTFNPDQNTSRYQVRAYQAGLIKINDNKYTSSIIITPSGIIENWPPQTIEALKDTHLKVAEDLNIDILLIGSGEKHEFIPIELYGRLLNRGIGVEVMSTGAACRTYNALSAENRNVAAALIIR